MDFRVKKQKLSKGDHICIKNSPNKVALNKLISCRDPWLALTNQSALNYRKSSYSTLNFLYEMAFRNEKQFQETFLLTWVCQRQSHRDTPVQCLALISMAFTQFSHHRRSKWGSTKKTFLVTFNSPCNHQYQLPPKLHTYPPTYLPRQ